jgi:hypothetical protein
MGESVYFRNDLEEFMGDGVKPFFNPDDGCTYFYDRDKRCYRKICDVGSFNKLPDVVKLQIKAVKENAEEILTLPT